MIRKYQQETLLSYHYIFGTTQYLGQILGNQGRFDAAIAAFEEAIELAPSYGAAYYNLGFVLNAVDRTEEGKAAIQKALLLTRQQTDR